MTFQFPKTPKQLTKAESLILDYVSNHTEAVLFSSIGQISFSHGKVEHIIDGLAEICGRIFALDDADRPLLVFSFSPVQ